MECEDMEVPGEELVIDDIPAANYASVSSGDYEYEPIGTSDLKITKYNGTATEVEIPEKLDEKTVVSIEAEAFKNNTTITYVTIPDTVTSMGKAAFRGCTALTTVVLSNQLKSIPEEAFYNCAALTSIDIPASVGTIENFAFGEDKSITSVTFHEGLVKIGKSAFENCAGIQSISLPSGLQKMGVSVFYGCTGLARVDNIPKSLQEAGGDTDSWGVFSGCGNLTEVSFEEGITTIPDLLFRNCTGLENVTIPATVKTIGMGAFYKCSSLKAIDIPASVGTIENFAFGEDKSITSVTFHEGLVKIGKSAFENCAGIQSISLPSGLQKMGVSVFYGCTGLARVDNIPKSLQEAGGDTDSWGVFSGCGNLTEVSFEEGITTIPNLLFRNCTGLENVTIPATVKTIGMGAFYKCSGLKAVDIPASVSLVDRYAFAECNLLKEIVFKEESTYVEIKEKAFSGCTALEKAVLPLAVREIGSSAFSSCPQLTIYCVENSKAYDYAKENNIPYEITGTVKTGAVAATVKQSTKFNLFYKDSEAVFYITSATGKVQGVTMADTRSFKVADFDPASGKLTVGYDDASAALDKTATLKIYVDGYLDPTSKAVTIATVNTKPKLSVNRGTTSFYKDGTSSGALAVKDNSTGKLIRGNGISLSSAYAAYDPLTRRFTANINADGRTFAGTRKKTVTVSLTVSDENWTGTISLNHKLTIASAATKPEATFVGVKLKKSSVTLNKKAAADKVVIPVVIGTAGYSAATLKTTDEYAQKFLLECKSGMLTVTLKEGTAAGKYVLPLEYTLKSDVDDTEVVKLNTKKSTAKLTIKVIEADATPKLKKAGKIDLAKRYSGITYTITGMNKMNYNPADIKKVVLDGTDADKFNVSKVSFNAKGQAYVIVTPKAEANLSTSVKYQYSLKVMYGTDENAFSVTSSVYKVKPSQSRK